MSRSGAPGCAFASRAFAGSSTCETIFPLIALAIMFVPYYFWKRYGVVKNTQSFNSRLALV